MSQTARRLQAGWSITERRHRGAPGFLQDARAGLHWSFSLRALATVGSVAYDEALADRMRELLAAEADLSEMKMFGGLAFLVGGNIALAASGEGGIMVRVDRASSDRLVATTRAHLVEMRGRPMKGWLRVDADDLRTKRQLAKWVELGTTYARSLPPKR